MSDRPTGLRLPTKIAAFKKAPPRRSKSYSDLSAVLKPNANERNERVRRRSLTRGIPVNVTSTNLKLPASRIAPTSRTLPLRAVPAVVKTQPSAVKPQASGVKPQPQSSNIKPPVKAVKPVVKAAVAPARVENKENKTNDALANRKRKIEEKPAVGGKRQKDKFLDFKTRYNNLLEKHKKFVEEQKQKYSELSEKYDAAAQELQVGNELNEELTKDINVYKKRCEGLESKVKEHLKNYTQVKCEKDRLDVQLESLTQNVHEYETKCEELESELREQTKKYDAMMREQESLNRQYELLNEKLNLTQGELSDKSEQLLQSQEQLRKEDSLRRKLLNMVQDLKGSIRVICRVRPPLPSEEDRMLAQIAVLDEVTLEVKRTKENANMKYAPGKQEYRYDKVFPAGSTQEEVFGDLSELVQSTLDGYNVCVFAYGQTGSGKTYTMQGNEENLGMIPRTIDLLFKKIEEMKLIDWTFSIQASFIEIYNESIVDLLNPKTKHQYDIRHSDDTTKIANLQCEEIKTASELYQLMYTAQKNRAVASTNFNEHSSRSHAITKIDIRGVQAVTNLIHCSSMNLVDLAGSESAKTSTADRLTETKNINKSLSALGNVMLALYNKESHVPYRDSKLTYLLQPCLGGNSKTLMFVNIAPFEETYNETINSLRFADKVKEVKVNVKRNRTIQNTPKGTF